MHQEDALLCGPSIESFLQYDYVGAPWPTADRMVKGKAWLQDVGGNGGLSLRRRSQASYRQLGILLTLLAAALKSSSRAIRPSLHAHLMSPHPCTMIGHPLP